MYDRTHTRTHTHTHSCVCCTMKMLHITTAISIQLHVHHTMDPIPKLQTIHGGHTHTPVYALSYLCACTCVCILCLHISTSTCSCYCVVVSHRMACSRCAFLTSGFWFLFCRMDSSVAPWMARVNLTFLRVRFLDTSSTVPFLCLRR